MPFEIIKSGGFLRQFGLSLAIAVAVVGCAAPKVHEQRLVSQPSMTFSSSGIWRHESALAIQLESGRANSGGGQSAGCTSCR